MDLKVGNPLFIKKMSMLKLVYFILIVIGCAFLVVQLGLSSMIRFKFRTLLSDEHVHSRWNNASSNGIRTRMSSTGPTNTSTFLLPASNNACSKEYKSRHLMTSYLYGRTGNRLFILMTLIAAANDSCFTAFLRHEKIDFLDTIFDIKNIAHITADISQFGKIRERACMIYNGPIVNHVSSDRNWIITGCRQSYRYFQHKKELVTSSFVFKDDIKSNVTRFLESFGAKTKVGVHVRRKDFLIKEMEKNGYFASSVTYILRSIEYFKLLFNGSTPVFIFVSDDIAWCKEHFKFDNVYFSPFKHHGNDLYILTQCDHNIITTGTFGWMGAWLNETGKVVYDKSFPRYKSNLWALYRRYDYYPDTWVGL